MKVTAVLSHEKLDAKKQNSPHLVVTVQAPRLDWVDVRPPLCITAVVDLSGSMDGYKMKTARTSLLKLVNHLLPGDIFGIVGFNSRVSDVLKPALLTPEHKQKAIRAIQAMDPKGSTDLWSGVLRAIELVENLDIPPNFLKRAIVFTDGQPTTGLTDKNAILKFVKDRRNALTVSAFGYGETQGTVYSDCDHTFLTDFSREGAGNYAYVQDQESALVAFGRELGGLCSTYAQDISIEITPQQNHSIDQIVTDAPIDFNLGVASVWVPDILAEETRHFVFTTKLSSSVTGPRAVSLFKVKVHFKSLDATGNKTSHTVEVKAKAQFVASGEETKEVAIELDKIIALAQLIRVQLQAEEAAKQGQFDRVEKLFDGLSTDLTNRRQDVVLGATNSVRSRFVNPSVYTSSQGFLRSFQAGGTRAYGLGAADEGAALVLNDVGTVFSNSVADAYTQSFVQPDSKK